MFILHPWKSMLLFIASVKKICIVIVVDDLKKNYSLSSLSMMFLKKNVGFIYLIIIYYQTTIIEVYCWCVLMKWLKEKKLGQALMALLICIIILLHVFDQQCYIFVRKVYEWQRVGIWKYIYGSSLPKCYNFAYLYDVITYTNIKNMY